LQTAAIQVLGNWKGVKEGRRLQTTRTTLAALKLVSLRSYINLIRAEGVAADQKLAMCKEASALSDRNEDTKLLLSVLDTAPSVETLAMAMSHLDNKAIRTRRTCGGVDRERSSKIRRSK
jgi:hypothetical protein